MEATQVEKGEQEECNIWQNLQDNKNTIFLIVVYTLFILLSLSIYYNVVLILYEKEFTNLNSKVSNLFVKFNENVKHREEEFDTIYKRIVDLESKKYM